MGIIPLSRLAVGQEFFFNKSHRRGVSHLAGAQTMIPSIQRGRLTVASLMVVVVACSTGFCVALPLAIGEWKGALAFGNGLLLV